MSGEPLRIGQRRRGFRTKLLHGGHQLAEQIQLQAKPWGGDLGAHLQRVAGDVRQMMAFIEDQQQVFRLGSTASLSIAAITSAWLATTTSAS